MSRVTSNVLTGIFAYTDLDTTQVLSPQRRILIKITSVSDMHINVHVKNNVYLYSSNAQDQNNQLKLELASGIY